MRLISIFQSKNEGIKNVKEVIAQTKQMSDGLIILDDNSTDNSNPPEVINDPHIIEYVKLPEKEMYEGINMSILNNLLRKHRADWTYLCGGHYRYIGDLKSFKQRITELDNIGFTHVNIRWLTLWTPTHYRNDKSYNNPYRRYCNIWKMMPNTNFNFQRAHCCHPENQIEVHTILTNFVSINYGRSDKKQRQDKYDLYTKLEKIDKTNESFKKYLEEDVPLKEYDEEEILKNVRNDYNGLPVWIRWNKNTFIPLIKKEMKKT